MIDGVAQLVEACTMYLPHAGSNPSLCNLFFFRADPNIKRKANYQTQAPKCLTCSQSKRLKREESSKKIVSPQKHSPIP